MNKESVPVELGFGVQITLNKIEGKCVIDSDSFNYNSRQTQIIRI